MHWFPAGIIGPLQPKSSKMTTVLLIATAAVFATTSGYDSGLMTGINIMPSYTEFLQLTTATRALSVSANFIGWGIASLTMGPLVDKVGRKNAVLISLLVKCFSVGLIAGARNFAMFISGRILLGVAKAETLPPKIRGLGLSITFSVYYIGALIAAGVTYRTAQISGEWSWRIPCLLQVVPSFVSGFCLFCTPESPRWLAYHDRTNEALLVVASVRANGDQSDTEVILQHQEIITARDFEREAGRKVSFVELFKTRSSRRRVMLAVSVSVIAMGSGNNIASYFLGDMLGNAGITDKNTQLEINVVMNSWCLVCAAIGTLLMDRVGRKTLCLCACTGMTVMMFILGGLTKTFSTSENLSGIYGTVAAIFLFMGSYSIGVTPVTNLYPPEVLSYSIRANGMALWAGVIAAFAIGTTLVFPIALQAISWRLYFILGAWDFLESLFVRFFWVETKGLSLEEIDQLFNGDRLYDQPSSEACGEDNIIDGQD
ncbi:hexose transporter [Dactylonectria macrodidyma]|uniref:Hexose transporter n=1 Tax=Dactylonectria macrodidyma TaxID=307937 RepID=A0A9P9FAV9_9HYPO|nr:hexose transporter [Dactylonectria macrodidyma]